MAEEERGTDEALFGRGGNDEYEEDPFSLRDLFEREACGSCGDWPVRHPVKIVIEHCDEMVIGG